MALTNVLNMVRVLASYLEFNPGRQLAQVLDASLKKASLLPVVVPLEPELGQFVRPALHYARYVVSHLH